MEQAVIPSSITGTMSDAVKQFQRLGALKLLSGPPLAGVCPLKHRLISSGLSDAQQLHWPLRKIGIGRQIF